MELRYVVLQMLLYNFSGSQHGCNAHRYNVRRWYYPHFGNSALTMSLVMLFLHQSVGPITWEVFCFDAFCDTLKIFEKREYSFVWIHIYQDTFVGVGWFILRFFMLFRTDTSRRHPIYVCCFSWEKFFVRTLPPRDWRQIVWVSGFMCLSTKNQIGFLRFLPVTRNYDWAGICKPTKKTVLTSLLLFTLRIIG